MFSDTHADKIRFTVFNQFKEQSSENHTFTHFGQRDLAWVFMLAEGLMGRSGLVVCRHSDVFNVPWWGGRSASSAQLLEVEID